MIKNLLNRKKKQTHDITKVEILSKSSPFAFSEAFKSLRTNLSFVTSANQVKRIALTSAVPGEGKSSVAINLSITLAENGEKVLLMDCDLRKPSIHKYMGFHKMNRQGVSNVLSGTVDPVDVIYRHKTHQFDVMFSGPIPPNPAELLGGKYMDQLFDSLKDRYDYIICDTPPVSVVTDAAVISLKCDGVLMIIKQNYATFEEVKTAKTNLETVKAKILGTVLNQYDLLSEAKDGSRHYYYDHYAYGYEEVPEEETDNDDIDEVAEVL